LLSVKEAEDTPQATIDAAEKAVEDLQNNMWIIWNGSNNEPTLVDCGIRFDWNSWKP
jgi:hypothetical protein